MSQHEAQQFADSLFAAFIGLILFFIWVAYIISATRSLKKIRQEAEKHTELLREIARNTRPSAPPGEPAKKAADQNYLSEPKSSAGTLLVVFGVIFAVLLIGALLSKK